MTTLAVTTLASLMFPSAILSYAGLTANLALVAMNRYRPMHMLPVALVALFHVFLVWHMRYGWDIGQATRPGTRDL